MTRTPQKPTLQQRHRTAAELKAAALARTARLRAHHVHVVLTTIAFGLFWVPVIIFAKLADEVIEKEPLRIDTIVIDAVHSIHNAGWDNFFLFWTAIGEPLVVISVAAALFGMFLYRRHFRNAAVIMGGVGGAGLANVILKGIFARSRPSIFTPLVHETSYSFPSGHAMVSAAFVCVLMIVFWHTRFRYLAVIGGFALTFLIGLSRVYLGVHYPSDIVAGWSVGLIWAVLAGSIILNRPFALGRRLTPKRFSA